MPDPLKPIKMLGPVAWCVLGDNYQGRIERAILRKGTQLVIDVECDGRRYSAKLDRSAHDLFEGRWTRRGMPGTGTASARLYHSSAGDLLFGQWVEDHTTYQWWAHLSVVKQFPDESAASR
jgi:hypothetical protein